MKPAKKSFALDRYTQIGELSASLRDALRRRMWLIFGVCAIVVAYLFGSGRPGAAAFAMIAGSSCGSLLVWSRMGKGLPMLPLLAAQNLVIYGMPIALGHDVVADAGEAHLFQAGLEVLVYSLAMTAAWRLGMQAFTPAKPFSYVLVDVDREGVQGLNRLGFLLIFIATAYAVIQSLGLSDIIIDRLPDGSYSIVVALISATSGCGFFMAGLSFGSGGMSPGRKLAFWGLLALESLITASSFLLSAAAINLVAAAIGLFWGSGRPPWRFVLTVGLMLSFLNVGKFNMRDRYWSGDEDARPPDMGLSTIPAHYAEWMDASYQAITESSSVSTRGIPRSKLHAANRQSLTDRIDNLQNLLFVIDAMDTYHVEPVHGATYTMIPALLIPRILWPDKPRTHEGQVLLNVHFGRQDLNSTLTTYVAWGILPEAYGNFGPFIGALLLGAVIGLFFAWIENWSARKLAISLEGIAGFALLLNMLNSYEMVASVLVTSTFQNLVPIVAAFLPFVRRRKLARPEAEAA